jgi:hypothetical protein
MGIGPEVTVKALAARPRDAMLIGSGTCWISRALRG